MIPFKPSNYLAIGLLATERRADEAILSVRFTSANLIFPAPSLSCHQIAIGLAIAIVEYIPNVMPTSKAREKLLSTSPPNNTNDKTDKSTKPAVITVRESV